jgi:hypothetical protein
MSSKNQQRRAKLLRKNEDPDAEFLDKMVEEVKAQAATQPPVVESAAQDKDTTSKPTGEDFAVPRQKVIDKANEIWNALKAHARDHHEFKSLKDQDKLDLFRNKFGCAMFMDEFPIVSRYMLCYGQYSAKAFDRMLRKIENVVHPPVDKREKNYMEDQWVQRQADYVQFLWESYQKRHQNLAEKQFIWKEAYDRLKKEFDDFRDMHKEIEERVKVEKKTLAGQNARELLERISNNSSSLSAEEQELLLQQLKEVFENKMNPNKPPEEEPEDLTKSTEPKILMIESVDNERMNEIDDKYKPAELRGMTAVMESEGDLAEDEVLLEEIVVE